MGGTFEYDRCHIAELPVQPNEPQEAIVLYAEDPLNIYLTPSKQIDLATTIPEQVKRKTKCFCRFKKY